MDAAVAQDKPIETFDDFRTACNRDFDFSTVLDDTLELLRGDSFPPLFAAQTLGAGNGPRVGLDRVHSFVKTLASVDSRATDVMKDAEVPLARKLGQFSAEIESVRSFADNFVNNARGIPREFGLSTGRANPLHTSAISLGAAAVDLNKAALIKAIESIHQSWHPEGV